MARYIDADKAMSAVCIGCNKEFPDEPCGPDCCEIRREMESIPTADVAEVKHGEWYVTEYEYLNCSICGEAMYTGCNSTQEANLLKDHWKSYCPNCGAKMDGGKAE